MQKRPFVLSGGGARGAAHIGVLKAFAENGIEPGVISATSAGSIVGALICDGHEADEILEVISTQKIFDSFIWRTPAGGLFSLEPLKKMLEKKLKHQLVEELPVKLFIAATDFNTGKQKIFSKGPIIPAVMAACSIPIVFTPVMIDDIPYADGGLSNNLPVEPLIKKHKDIIGVHVNPLPAYNPKASYAQRIDRAMHLTIIDAVQRSKAFCSMFIEPPLLQSFGLFDAKKARQMAEIGYQFTNDLLHQ